MGSKTAEFKIQMANAAEGVQVVLHLQPLSSSCSDSTLSQ